MHIDRKEDTTAAHMEHFLFMVSGRLKKTIIDTWPFNVVNDKMTILQMEEFRQRLAADVAYEIELLRKGLGEKGND